MAEGMSPTTGTLMTTLTITQARQAFLGLPEQVQDEAILVTRHGRPVMAVLSAEQFEGLMETLEILSDQAFSQRLTKSIQQAKEGKTKSLADVRKRLGI